MIPLGKDDVSGCKLLMRHLRHVKPQPGVLQDYRVNQSALEMALPEQGKGHIRRTCARGGGAWRGFEIPKLLSNVREIYR
jgi:hypothetical protein